MSPDRSFIGLSSLVPLHRSQQAMVNAESCIDPLLFEAFRGGSFSTLLPCLRYVTYYINSPRMPADPDHAAQGVGRPFFRKEDRTLIIRVYIDVSKDVLIPSEVLASIREVFLAGLEKARALCLRRKVDFDADAFRETLEYCFDQAAHKLAQGDSSV